MNTFFRLALALTLISPAACATDMKKKSVTVSPAQAAALALVVSELQKGGNKLPSCEIWIENTEAGIEISFIDSFDKENPYQVGATSEICNFTYVVDSSGTSVRRKYFHR